MRAQRENIGLSTRYLVVCVAASVFAACTSPPRVEAGQVATSVGDIVSVCPAHAHATLEGALAPDHPDYEAVLSTCVSRSTPGWVDVHGILAATSAVDVHVVATIESSGSENWMPVGAELQAPLGWALGTPLGGSAYVLAGNHIVSIRVATGAPNASVVVLSGSWIEAEARQ